MNEAALRHTWKGSDMGNHKLTFPEKKVFLIILFDGKLVRALNNESL